MKTIIRRASNQYATNSEPPCANAYSENGVWFIDISTMDDLITLINEVNVKLIIDKEDWYFDKTEYPLIVIYDEYVE